MFGTVRARYAKFCMQMHSQGYLRKKCKIRSKWVGKGLRDLLLHFRDHLLGTVRDRDIKLGKQIHHQGTNERNAEFISKGSERGHVTYLWNFVTPSISRERSELETSHYACRFITRVTNERKPKLGQKGSGKGHPTYFSYFWDPVHISGMVGSRNVKFGLQIHSHGY